MLTWPNFTPPKSSGIPIERSLCACCFCLMSLIVGTVAEDPETMKSQNPQPPRPLKNLSMIGALIIRTGLGGLVYYSLIIRRTPPPKKKKKTTILIIKAPSLLTSRDATRQRRSQGPSAGCHYRLRGSRRHAPHPGLEDTTRLGFRVVQPGLEGLTQKKKII